MTKIIGFDYAIKYLLKDKSNFDMVGWFISAILKDAGYSAVKITSLLETASNKETEEAKSSVADVIVEDAAGHKYIVEIDKSYTNAFLPKTCFNSSRLVVDSISTGDDYSEIKKIFHINLLYFRFDKMKTPLYHGKTIFRELDKEHPVNLHIADMGGKIFDAYNIFPEYFVVSVPLFNDVIRNELDEWLYLTKHSEVREDFKSPYMKKVAERLNILKMSPAELKAYQRYVKEDLKQRDYFISATEKGKAEEKIEIAKNLLRKNIDINVIADSTGLTTEEIEKLKAEIEKLEE